MDRSLRKSALSIKGTTGLHIIIIFVLSVSLGFPMAFANDTQKSSCSAPQDYLQELNRFADSIRVEQDYSCLIDLPSVNPKISQYQIISIQPETMVDNAWMLPLNDLKLKSYLNDRKLLLLGDGFSLVKAAAACAELKNNNFTQTKILVGGAAHWRQYKENKQLDFESRLVSPKDFLYEYFNGTILVIAVTEKAQNQLRILGVDKLILAKSTAAVTDIVIEKSQSGYLPVVVIGDLNGVSSLLNQYANLFLLEGGITGLKTQLQNDVMTELSRFDNLGATTCEAL